MCGVFPGETRMPARRVVSYVEGASNARCPMGAARFRGHEFHYSGWRSIHRQNMPTNSRGASASGTRCDGAVIKNTLGSYTHLHRWEAGEYVRNFVDNCRGRK